ncbi:signal recognition particle protein [Helicobacter fennelliae]|uniref:signal-recognition-particle GTPase n=1 Tax=Helicobacter fennelliae MRY12-0050 TaxID=1325130 RepID=T1DX88_9HELI|nr:signal recognition particle protein [Helicobacter fennelliae]GAD20047.1 signal recognition particle, subunit Ffh SRP54 [Helicobacter fennelliae MRY12-0050]STP07760.1 signal recognition particle protein [Helicobacter fennelliae]STQ84556.1 signal recognition particle protein [Helicobacter fennelliae]
MFDTLSSSFRSIASKIRFNDDQKSLDRALEELKKTLLKNDVYHKVVKEIINQIAIKTKQAGIGRQNFLKAMQESFEEILTTQGNYGFVYASKPPTIVLMTGLQGSGKTTTSAKLANYLKTKNKKVLLVACDMQRLAAVSQLETLGRQIEVEVFALPDKSALEVARAAKERAIQGQFDVMIIDSAGRLAIDSALMNELKSIKQEIKPDETLYVVDSLSGQDGIRSAESFHKEIGLSGVILSKFDSDSKGGIALNIAYQIQVPLRFLGNGEKIPDLDIFIPDRIVSRLMGAGDIISLAEKTAGVIDEKEAKNITKKLKKGQFGFEDFLAQIENIKKLGSMGSIMSMIPGLSQMAGQLKNIDLDNSKEIKDIKAMVNSMTPKERQNPEILNGSRRKRIALGAGLEVADINRIIKQFDNAAKIAKKMSQKGGMQDILGLMGQMRQKS